MNNFNGNDDEFNDEFNEDFLRQWEKFNQLRNTRRSSGDYNKFRSELENLIRLITSQKTDEDNFRFIPLNNIPEDEFNVEKGEDESGEWERKDWTSPDGSMSFMSFTRSSSFDDIHGANEEAFELFNRLKDLNGKRPMSEESKKVKLAKLNRTLEYLVEQENYEKAAEIKKMIDDLNKPTEEKTEEN